MVRTAYSVEYLERLIFFFQAEDGIRDLVRSRGLGDVYKRQPCLAGCCRPIATKNTARRAASCRNSQCPAELMSRCLLYTSDAADERSSVDLGGRRIIKKKNRQETLGERRLCKNSIDTDYL